MQRRSFLKWLTNGLGALFAAVLGFPAISYLIDPRNRPGAAGAFKRVARLSELKDAGGEPIKSVVRDVRRDAWTLHPNDVIGRVWLVWRGQADDKGAPVVEAYTATCPHLGGSINYDRQQQRFVCPLHGAAFDYACRRLSEELLGRANPAPRDMDSLEVQLVSDPENEGDYFVEVKYQNFVQGKPQKEPKA